MCQRSDAVLLGAVGDPKYDDPQAPIHPEDGLLALRKELGLFANVRPAKVYPALAGASTLRREIVENIDLIVMRELTGGIYFGEPKGITNKGKERVGFNTLIYSESEIERIARASFDMAMKRRKKVTSVEKANVLDVMQLWREVWKTGALWKSCQYIYRSLRRATNPDPRWGLPVRRIWWTLKKHVWYAGILGPSEYASKVFPTTRLGRILPIGRGNRAAKRMEKQEKIREWCIEISMHILSTGDRGRDPDKVIECAKKLEEYITEDKGMVKDLKSAPYYNDGTVLPPPRTFPAWGIPACWTSMYPPPGGPLTAQPTVFLGEALSSHRTRTIWRAGQVGGRPPASGTRWSRASVPTPKPTARRTVGGMARMRQAATTTAQPIRGT